MPIITWAPATLRDPTGSCSPSPGLAIRCSDRTVASGSLGPARRWLGIHLQNAKRASGPDSAWLTICWTTWDGAASTFLPLRALGRLLRDAALLEHRAARPSPGISAPQ